MKRTKDLNKRMITDYDALGKIAATYRLLGWTVGVTIGSFDWTHIGHWRYLAKASDECDILIVGLDSDRVLTMLKGEPRPIVHELERMENVLHTGYVDIVTLVDDVPSAEEGWQYELIKAVQPDVFIAEETSYSDKQLEELRGLVQDVKVLPRQAATSTTEKSRDLMLRPMRIVSAVLHRLADQLEEGNLDVDLR